MLGELVEEFDDPAGLGGVGKGGADGLHVGRLSAPGSRLFLERGRDVTAAPPDTELTHITGLWKGGLGPGTHEWLAEHGWSVQVSKLGAVAAGYGRPAPAATSAGFVSAERTAS